MEDDDVGREKSHDEIKVEEDFIGEKVAPIVKERDIDSSCAEMSESTVTPSVNASEGKTAGPPIIPEELVKVDVSSGADVRESCAEDILTENIEGPSTEGVGANVDPSVKDTLDGLKDSTPFEFSSMAALVCQSTPSDHPSWQRVELLFTPYQ
ncbi:hypothetical protein LIER_26156 [Lithospermum erythrorhizon]|uniref:Uncharacterized protein n=1 Tax=Lithospermum erythrorhizon TaxID=34254 RepID=A0AAV3R8X7_LITER